MRKQVKKLTLTKETLRKLEDLGEKDRAFVLGGISGSACTNPTCIQLCAKTTDC